MHPPSSGRTAGEESSVNSIPHRMVNAWNVGSARLFAASFADDADYIAFEGSHFRGRDQIVAFHQPLFDTVLKGSRLEGEVKFVRFLRLDLAVMYAASGTALPGQRRTTRSRDSMQLFVVTKEADEWRVAAALNARRLSLQLQTLADDFEALSKQAQERVRELVDSLLER